MSDLMLHQSPASGITAAAPKLPDFTTRDNQDNNSSKFTKIPGHCTAVPIQSFGSAAMRYTVELLCCTHYSAIYIVLCSAVQLIMHNKLHSEKKIAW